MARSEPTPAASRAHTMTFPSRHYRRCAVPIRAGAPQSYVECCRSKRPCNSYPVICCASAIAGNDRTRLSYVSAARTPYPRRRLAAGRDPAALALVSLRYRRPAGPHQHSGWSEPLCAPGRIRTRDPLLRRQLLCPAELRAPGDKCGRRRSRIGHVRVAVCRDLRLSDSQCTNKASTTATPPSSAPSTWSYTAERHTLDA
jgi:hypothetical protein